MGLIIIFRHLASSAIMASPPPDLHPPSSPAGSRNDFEPLPESEPSPSANDTTTAEPPANGTTQPTPETEDIEVSDQQPDASTERTTVQEMHAQLEAEVDNDFADWDTTAGAELRMQMQAKEDSLAAEIENVSRTSLPIPRFSATVERRHNAD